MKKTIITPVLALILGFIAGFCFRDYYMKKQDNVKTPEIETKDKTSSNGTIPHIWKSHATLTLLATQDCPLWLQYD